MAEYIAYKEVLSEFEKQSVWSRAWHSIRTRYSLATAFLLLTALSVFYIGGRIVLVHLVRDTEARVKQIGADISRIAYRNSDVVRERLVASVMNDGGASLAVGREYSLLLKLDAHGGFRTGSYVDRAGAVAPVSSEMLANYREELVNWCGTMSAAGKGMASTGIIKIADTSHYVALTSVDGECVILGMPFESRSFLGTVNEELSGFEIKIARRGRPGAPAVEAGRNAASRRATDRGQFGVAPMLSEALDFYTGGFWKLHPNRMEAVFAVRDIAGNTVTAVSVSIPESFASVTHIAVGRLAFFVAVVGLVFVLPIFWFQSRVLLNPLTKMTKEIATMGEKHRDIDCPRLDWKGKDEFALLAVSVNRMLETISARAVAVAQSEARQRALIDAIPDALAVFDRQHRLVTMTKDSADFGVIPFAVPGEEFPEFLFGAEGKRKFEETLDRVFAGEKEVRPIRLELQHAKWVPKDHPSRYFDIRLVKMDDLFSLALIRDITNIVNEHRQLVGAREKLKESEKRESLALLAAGIAHDINNILTIIGNTTVATWVDSTDPDEKLAVDTIGDALQRGSMMMRELMDYAGESRIKFERVSPMQVLNDIENILRGLLSESVELDLDIPADIPDIDGGHNQLFKVFLNIVKNAVEAIGKRPGRIVVRARKFTMTQEALIGYRSSTTLKPGVGVLFTISDNGPGIRPEILHRLFDPYVSSKALGRGLGLATVASVVEAHGGGIRVDSVVERGTTFSIFLPESKLPKTLPDPVAGKFGENAAGGPGGEILVVDDEEHILKTSAMLLKALKYTSHQAKDSASALEEVRRHGENLSAIILDASLGDVDTVRLALAFRKNAPTVPIIVSSGSTEEYIRNLFAGVKIDAILSKPYTLAELRSTLASVSA